MLADRRACVVIQFGFDVDVDFDRPLTGLILTSQKSDVNGAKARPARRETGDGQDKEGPISDIRQPPVDGGFLIEKFQVEES